jgi:hypothetical protein
VPVLYIVLALVLAAFGLLIAALTTANTLWAWISVVLSVVAAALLVTDWVNGRRRARAEEQARPTVVTVGGRRPPADEPDRRRAAEPAGGDRDADFDEEFEAAFADRGDVGETPVAPLVGAGPDAAADTGFIEPVHDDGDDGSDDGDDGEPGEEPTDAADLLVVSDLSVEVRVVDEHPRYHLPNCRWLAGRGTIPIAVSEARQLGFTPCARCGPDAVLAARHRAGR